MRSFRQMGCVIVLSGLLAGNAYAVTRYVNASNAAPAAPYTNWGSASTNIQTAIDASASGDEILVAPGVYRIAARLQIPSSKTLILRSTQSRAAVVDAQRLCEGMIVQGSNSVVEGFTFRNGMSSSYGGGVSLGRISTLRDCLVTGNQAWGAGGVMMQANGAVVENCTIVSNLATYWGGGVILYDQTTGLVNNCVIADNVASNYGGGVALQGAGTVSNCWIADNRAVLENAGGADLAVAAGDAGGGAAEHGQCRQDLHAADFLALLHQMGGGEMAGLVGQDADQLVGRFGVDDGAVLADQEGGAVGAAHHLVEHAVGLGHGAVGPEVRQDREGVALLLGPHLLGVLRVAGDGEHGHAGVGVLRVVVTEAAELALADAGEGERVEDQGDGLLALEVGELDLVAVLVRQLEVGGGGAGGEGHGWDVSWGRTDGSRMLNGAVYERHPRPTPANGGVSRPLMRKPGPLRSARVTSGAARPTDGCGPARRQGRAGGGGVAPLRGSADGGRRPPRPDAPQVTHRPRPQRARRRWKRSGDRTPQPQALGSAREDREEAQTFRMTVTTLPYKVTSSGSKTMGS